MILLRRSGMARLSHGVEDHCITCMSFTSNSSGINY